MGRSPNLSPSQVWFMWRTIEMAMRQLATVAPTLADRIGAATDNIGPHAFGGDKDAHPLVPRLGETNEVEFIVERKNLAASMGHPDPEMDVLGSPDISLWFEISTNALMPAPSSGAHHVGVGILTHHLSAARLDETVSVVAQVTNVYGRTVTFSCEARVGDRIVGLGVHQRVILG